MQVRTKRCGVFLAALSLSALAIPQARAGFALGDAANFVVLYEGNGNNQLSTTNVTINGNIGIGDPSGSTTSNFAFNNPGTINGNVLFAGSVLLNGDNGTLNGTITGGNANVQTDLNLLNSLSTTLGAESGTALSVALGGSGQSQTINASAGTLDASGNRVFTVGSFQFNNGETLIINGDAAGDSVVLNFTSGAQFNGTIALNGITSDQVLFNFTGGAALMGGNTLQTSTNGAVLEGVFLDPNGAMSLTHSVLDGRFFGGDSSNMQIVSGDTINAPVPAPEPSTLSLLGAGLLVMSGLVGRRKALLA